MGYNAVIRRIVEESEDPLLRCDAHFVPGDLRKFCEQLGDILQWDQSNENYILTHGVSGVDWRFYKQPLPEHVYNIYMKSWADVDLAGYRPKMMSV
jgi:hypothetical protein